MTWRHPRWPVCHDTTLQLRRPVRSAWKVVSQPEQDAARPGARIQSGPSHAARRGAPPPPTIMAIVTALPRLLMATAAPATTWLLPLNVVIVDNDRGDSPSSCRARVLRAGAPELPPGTPWMHARWQPSWSGRAVEPERARWHDPVLGRWLRLTPERPALCLRGFPGRPSAGWP